MPRRVPGGGFLPSGRAGRGVGDDDPGGDHYVYVVACADGSLYAGYTTDVQRRVAQHNAGEGAKYTRGRTPVELRHVERFGSRSAALSREAEIKSLSRGRKEALIGDEAGAETGSGGDATPDHDHDHDHDPTPASGDCGADPSRGSEARDGPT